MRGSGGAVLLAPDPRGSHFCSFWSSASPIRLWLPTPESRRRPASPSTKKTSTAGPQPACQQFAARSARPVSGFDLGEPKSGLGGKRSGPGSESPEPRAQGIAPGPIKEKSLQTKRNRLHRGRGVRGPAGTKKDAHDCAATRLPRCRAIHPAGSGPRRLKGAAAERAHRRGESVAPRRAMGSQPRSAPATARRSQAGSGWRRVDRGRGSTLQRGQVAQGKNLISLTLIKC